MLRHYVFLKYREGTSDGHVSAFCERMLALRATIPGIEHLEIGRDELHDARSWDLVLVMEFATLDALRAYQRHPQHVDVMTFNAPFVANLGSVDFTSPPISEAASRHTSTEV
jgi:stress responsive alpha/beta barrel protein